MCTLGLEPILIHEDVSASKVSLSCTANGSAGLHYGTILRLEDILEVSSFTCGFLTEDGNWDDLLWCTVGNSQHAG